MWRGFSIGTMQSPWSFTYFKVEFVACQGTKILWICLLHIFFNLYITCYSHRRDRMEKICHITKGRYATTNSDVETIAAYRAAQRRRKQANARRFATTADIRLRISSPNGENGRLRCDLLSCTKRETELMEKFTKNGTENHLVFVSVFFSRAFVSRR